MSPFTARATRYGFDRARWRGLGRVAIQEYLTAAIQNIDVLLRYGRNPRKLLGAVVKKTEDGIRRMTTIIGRRYTLSNTPFYMLS